MNMPKGSEIRRLELVAEAEARADARAKAGEKSALLPAQHKED